MTTSLFKLLEHPAFREGEHWSRRRVAANHTVFAAGDGGYEVYLILSGAVRVLGSVDIDDQRRISPGFSDLGPGDVFGELPMFDHQPRSATVMTIADCEFAVMDGQALLTFLDGHPEVGYPIFKELIGTLVTRLRKANQRVFSLFAWGLKNRGLDTII